MSHAPDARRRPRYQATNQDSTTLRPYRLLHTQPHTRGSSLSGGGAPIPSVQRHRVPSGGASHGGGARRGYSRHDLLRAITTHVLGSYSSGR
ncbi:hypothetical protein [Porphyromonas endodontalis]|uniref:hypothetical protein n=1 Tax=Porphyromonas endodontalis TaxID=28124 RepID=UPI003C7BBE0A